MTYYLAILLCLIGLWISIYFTGVSFHWFSPDVKWIPQVCQLKEKTCQLVLETPRAKLFGIPNSVFGIGLYLFLLFLFFYVGAPFMAPFAKGAINRAPTLWWIGFIAIGLATARSIYLAYSLIFVTRVPCPLCFTSHAINLFLLVHLWLSR